MVELSIEPKVDLEFVPAAVNLLQSKIRTKNAANKGIMYVISRGDQGYAGFIEIFNA